MRVVYFEGEGWAALQQLCAGWRQAGAQIVTTNGCFDGLHAGHISLLTEARQQGDRLVVGLNSDSSVRALKGEGRPQYSEAHRALALSALRAVDAVVIFPQLLSVAFVAAIAPDVHCKGAEYTLDQMPEAASVRQRGGRIHFVPALAGARSTPGPAPEALKDEHAILLDLLGAANTIRQMAFAHMQTVGGVAQHIVSALKQGKMVFSCGNGGSAADADHFAAELLGHFSRPRGPLAARSLCSDMSTLTALANDFGYSEVFARQLEAYGQAGDVLLAISTSGRSKNVCRAVEVARARGMYVLALTGAQPGPVGEGADCCLTVPAQDVAWIQQGHRALLHALCRQIDVLVTEGA